jgi:hypothetical protein
MFTKNGISDSLLDAVKDVTKQDQEVRQYRAFGLTTESKNAPSKENGGIAHMCASHVQHATYGEGVCVPGEHTIVETAPGEGYVTHYDVDFNGSIVESVPVEDLEIIKEGSHMHSNVKKDKKKMIAGQKMDPVGKADADIDNDGDVDGSDDYLKNRRKAIKKSMGKEKVEIDPTMKEEYTNAHFLGGNKVVKVKSTGATGEVVGRHRQDDGDIHFTVSHGGGKTSKHPGSNLKVHKEETKVDSGLENPHNCATHVYSESWGDGRTVPTMHADPDEMGNVAWYDVMFEHGVEKGVPIEELKVIKSSHHGHKKRGSK